jgi:hypothetical protein
MKRNAVRWLGRRIAAPGPYLALCLSADDFAAALKGMRVNTDIPWIKTGHADATAHYFDRPNGGGVTVIVCMRDYEGRNPIEIAGLLVHEAAHAWQAYADSIGEDRPGREQEAYAVQAIAQELMAEFARRMA